MTGNLQPKISIVTPSYNQGKFLESTILSVLQQDYTNFEYIIVDGGSSDNSVDIIKKYEHQLTYWISEPDSGQSNAINKGFARASGDLFCWLNSDDCFVPGALSVMGALYRDNPHAGAFVGAGDYVDLKGRVLRRKEPAEVTLESLYDWLEICHFMQPSCFITRACWEFVGGVDESEHFAMDVDLWLKIARHFSFVRTNELISKSLVHDSAKTKAYGKFCEVDTAFVIMRHGGERQGRMAIEKIAAKLQFYENWLSFFTDTALFNKLLPTIHRIIGYDKKLRSLYPGGGSK